MYRRNYKGPKVSSWRSPNGIWNCLEVRQNTVYKNVSLMQNLRQSLDQLLANLQILYNIHFSNRILWFTVSKCLLKVNKTPQTS